MRTVNDADWAQQAADLRLDGELGERFLAYFELWFSTADTLMDEDGLNPADAMRKALDIAEADLGFLSVDLVGQMLVLALAHWKPGAVMMVGMTNIEHRVLETALARKVLSLQESAAAAEEGLRSSAVNAAEFLPAVCSD